MIDQTLPKRKTSYFKQLIRSLKNDQSGLALIEFAYSLPVLMGLGMFGTETAFLAVTNLKVSQAALNLADNASRMGQTDTGFVSPTINESDILEVFAGLSLQTDTIDLLKNGRVILSSLEVREITDPDDPDAEIEQQFIRWQRCLGTRQVPSKYDDDKEDEDGNPVAAPGDGITDISFQGMGADGALAQSVLGSAVMYVEIEYKYSPLFGAAFGGSRVLRQEAAFNIRDTRNLTPAGVPTGVFNDVGNDANGISRAAVCSKFTAS